ncbi:MAG: hypothetical protein CVV12_04770 [Gammaproteobacteria bacterium HGW-Gammaproteobacteria-2]|jgi:hypothetical protein|nr:MAG: hypothetical protein CVV12_04770 [Gammaproteobacteria bacterium HGW-Gammaproteobacteria-2]
MQGLVIGNAWLVPSAASVNARQLADNASQADTLHYDFSRSDRSGRPFAVICRYVKQSALPPLKRVAAIIVTEENTA